MAVAVSIGVPACTDGMPSRGTADGSEPVQPAVPTTAFVPPERSTRFCETMTDLIDRLENDPPDDVAGTILDAYRGLVDDVPEVIRGDFMAVLADLEGKAPSVDASDGDAAERPSSVPGSIVPDDPLPDEGFGPDDTPASRVNSYVGFVCRGVVNNPGPPDTQPR